MTRLVVRGFAQKEPDVRGSWLMTDDSDIRIDVAQVVELADATRDADANDVVIDGAAIDGIVEIEFDDGAQLWMRTSELKSSPLFSVENGAKRGDLRLAAKADTTRGSGPVARLVRFFRRPATQAFGDLARGALVEHLETRAHREHGLYRLVGGMEPQFVRYEVKHDSHATEPWLLLIHGTASSTESSFGDLWNTHGGASFERLRRHFRSSSGASSALERILAFEHPTLTADPLDNAIELVRALPSGAILHLLTHSRGGLIGELLARKADANRYYDEADVELFERAAGDRDAGTRLRLLDSLLRKKRIVVERFVRVGCPARGTTLASGRLERWLSVSLNLLGLAAQAGSAATGLAMHPALRLGGDLLKGVLLDLVKYEDLPGIVAMDPGSAMIRGLINASRHPSPGQLMVIAGRSRGNGVFARLGGFLVDVFFSNQNDLVVDTPSMFGGALRPAHGSFRFVQIGENINHFSYFRHAATVERMLSAFESKHLQAPDFEPFEIDQSKLRSLPVPARPSTRSVSPKPPICVVIPGIMGTHLRVRDKRVWLHYRRLLSGRFSDLAIETPDVMADELDGGTYRSIVEFLTQSHLVIPFPYDWRLPIEDSGKRLNALLHAQLASIDREEQPIRIVAHSMGGLVARSMMLEHDSAWGQICENPGARLLMMGTPNRGSHAISLLLTGQERTLRLLATLDISNASITRSPRDLVSVAARFGGALDMLPAFDSEDSTRDYFSEVAWDQVLGAMDGRRGWPRPPPEELARARAWRSRLDAQVLEPERVFYVAGVSRDTPSGIVLDPSGKKPPVFKNTREGDGRVPWDGGIPEGVAHWFVPAVHGSIPKYGRAHGAYLDILESGTTARLSDRRTVSMRSLFAEDEVGPGDRAPHGVAPSFLPDADDIMRAAVGADDEQENNFEQSLPPLVEVSIVWGNLSWSQHPLVVGHYSGDSIFSAEAALDRWLDGALSRRHASGIYPGPIGSSLVVRCPHSKPPGAIVVGLGQIGRLSAGDLATSVRDGVLRWAADELTAREQYRVSTSGVGTQDESANLERPTGLAMLLIGSGAAGLSLRDSARSLLSGVEQALLRLGNDQSADLALRSIEFIELYEDRAYTFWDALDQILSGEGSNDPLRDRFRLHPEIKSGTDGRRRLVIQEPDGWWAPLRIARKGDTFSFERVGERARAEQREVGTELEQVRRLVREGIASSRRDSELEIALFELLVPNELKEAAPRLDATRLLLDTDTAWIPWEMLTDRDSGRHRGRCGVDPHVEPQSVRTGMIRQLLLSDPPPRLRAAESRCALVIGDPRSRFAKLPGAQTEAAMVGQLLGHHGYQATPLLRPSAETVLRSLFRCGYRIIHLAGHGVEDTKDLHPSLVQDEEAAKSETRKAEALGDNGGSGFVIGDHDAITYRHIAQLREVPELVFINCCHLGNIEKRDYPRMAADFGEQFIKQGVRAVVAAGWAVEDSAALHFSEVFYRVMLSGQSFGDAVRKARRATFDRFPDSNTWAAYQCYGDPGFRMKINGNALSDVRESRPRFASVQHFILDGIQRSTSIDDLARVEALATERWGKDGNLDNAELLYEIALRYHRLHDLDRAKDRQWQALKQDLHGNLPARALDRYVNMEVRLAITDTASEKENRISRIRKARNLILPEREAEFEPSADRCAIIASSYKKEALLHQRPTCVENLRKAMSFYLQHAEKKMGESYGPRQAGTIDAALAWLLLSARSSTKGKAESEASAARTRANGYLREAKKRLGRLDTTDGFWRRVAPVDQKLAEAFVDGKLSSDGAADLAARYIGEAVTARDPGKMQSVVENLDFMIAILEMAKRASSAGLLADQLKEVRKRLSGARV